MVMMDSNERIRSADPASLEIIHYPDPRLAEVCTPIAQVDRDVVALAERMFELMYEGNGVGLAAPQVGVAVRLFVTSPTFDEADRTVYVNPQIIAAEGSSEDEEGCLSVPGVRCNVKRAAVITVRALDLAGQTFDQTLEGLGARVIQHENDHIDGRTIVNHMGTVARMTSRRLLKDLEKKFEQR